MCQKFCWAIEPFVTVNGDVDVDVYMEVLTIDALMLRRCRGPSSGSGVKDLVS